MKRSFHLLLFLFISQIVFSQVYFPLVDTGKVWSIYHNYCKEKSYPFSDYTRFEGDTLMDGMLFKKVWSSRDSLGTTWTANGFIREDAQKKVFLRYCQPCDESLLYDFGAQVGDYLHLQSNIYSAFIVDSVDIITLMNGEERRRFSLHDTGTLCIDSWIEGIGSVFGVLSSGPCTLVGDDPHLMCFSEHDTLKYHNPLYDKCFLITGISQKANNSLFKVFPNPVKETLVIEKMVGNDRSLSFEMYDLMGIKLIAIPLPDQKTSIHLKEMGLSPGVFLYRIMDGPSEVSDGKVVIL